MRCLRSSVYGLEWGRTRPGDCTLVADGVLGLVFGVVVGLMTGASAAGAAGDEGGAGGVSRASLVRTVPVPLPEHPGNVFLEGEQVEVRVPESLPGEATRWRLVDDRGVVCGSGSLRAGGEGRGRLVAIGSLGVGWYRVEFGSEEKPDLAWTTLAVLGRLRAPAPMDSPVAVDSAAAWFARGDAEQQRRLASLAALAGVNWVRDRLRWGDLQPREGPLVEGATTYDTSAREHFEAGLQVLQVFHDTPAWARGGASRGGQFAPDLRRVYEVGRGLAQRFRGRVQAWEPWNEANIAVFGGHTVDQMCSWQKAAWLGFKAGDPGVTVGWNVTAAVPTPAHTEGVLANETWPYYDTYNIHTYDWSHAYADLWGPAREAAAGRPLWITEADRGTPHLKNAPWFDQEPRLERLKAEWMAQSYASSLFAGADRHFHFILGHYHEPNGIQFGLLRLDLTPRPAYVALAAVGRYLAGARSLGRWQPGQDVRVYAFRAHPDGVERDVLVVWAEREVDWGERGVATADWALPAGVGIEQVVDYLGRSLGRSWPRPLTSAPAFVVLSAGASAQLPLEAPPVRSAWRSGAPSPVVFQVEAPSSAVGAVVDVPWSEGHVYEVGLGQALGFGVHVYGFGASTAEGTLGVERQPPGWEVALEQGAFRVGPMERVTVRGSVRIGAEGAPRDGWVVLRGRGVAEGEPVVAFRVRLGPVTFDRLPVGQGPAGWAVAISGEGQPRWTVEADETAPSKPGVLKQSGVVARPSYPLCLLEGVSMRDGYVEVKFKTVTGEIDQAAGVVWRYQDAGNYYICRANALEDNVVLYKVEGGKRTALDVVGRQGGYGVATKVAPGVWQRLRVEFAGSRAKVFLDGKGLFEVEDATFGATGRVGLWTKADSVTLFDDFDCGGAGVIR